MHSAAVALSCVWHFDSQQHVAFETWQRTCTEYPEICLQVVNAATSGKISSIASGTAIVENGTTTFDHLIISGAIFCS
jgi:hypothetical protein